MNDGDDMVRGCMLELQRKTAIGLGIIAYSGLMSAISVFVLLCFILGNLIRKSNRWRRIRTPLNAIIMSLLLSDLTQATGAMLSIKWAFAGRTYCCSACTMQGVLQQLGETGVALSTLLLAVHALFALAFCRRIEAASIWFLVISGAWFFMTFFMAISNAVLQNKSLYRPVPFWCGIGEAFHVQRILGQLWIWTSVVSSLLVSVSLWLLKRRDIRINVQSLRKFKFQMVRFVGCDRSSAEPGWEIIWFIVLYPLLSMPYWITRQMAPTAVEDRAKRQMTIYSTVIFTSFYNLLGLAHVLVFIFTRPCILLLNGINDGDSSDLRNQLPIPDTEKQSNINRSRSEQFMGVVAHYPIPILQVEKPSMGPPEECNPYRTAALPDSLFGIYEGPHLGLALPSGSGERQNLLNTAGYLLTKPLPALPPLLPPPTVAHMTSSANKSSSSVSFRSNSAGWWEMTEIGATWLSTTRPQSPGYSGLVRPDSVVLSPIS